MPEKIPGIRVEEVGKSEEREEQNEKRRNLEEWIKSHYTPEGGAPAMLRLFGIPKGIIPQEAFVRHVAHYNSGRTSYSIEGLEPFAARIAEYLTSSEKSVQLPEKIVQYKGIIHPPGEGEINDPTGENPKSFEEKPGIPRTRFFLQLMAEMRLTCEVIQGEENENIVRAEGYQMFYIGDPIKKYVSISNAWGEATYIQFNAEESDGKRTAFLAMKKEDMQKEGSIVRIIWTGAAESWKSMLFQVLRQESPDPDSLSPKDVQDILKTSDKALRQLIESFRNEHPNFIIAKGKGTHFTKEGIAYLRTIIPGKDWLSATNIKQKIKDEGGAGDQDTIRKRMEALQEDYPGDVLPIENKGIYASPRIIEMIVREFLARRKAPEGWKTHRAVAEMLNVHQNTLSKMIARMKKDGLEVKTEEFLDVIGHPREHISPEGIAILPKNKEKYVLK